MSIQNNAFFFFNSIQHFGHFFFIYTIINAKISEHSRCLKFQTIKRGPIDYRLVINFLHNNLVVHLKALKQLFH